MIGTGYYTTKFNAFYSGGGASFANDKSMIFDGVDEYITAGASVPELSGATNFSVSFWVKHTTLPAVNRLCRMRFTDQTWFEISTNGGRGNIIIANGSTTYGTLPVSSFTTGVWEHCVAFYDGAGSTNADKLKVYINGVSKTLTFTGTIPSSTYAFTTQPFDIGRGWQGNQFFNGSVDEFAIFDYTLTPTQIASIYNSGSPTDLSNTSGVTAPVHWWRMGDGSDTISTIYDVGTGTALDGTPTNMEAGDIQTDTP